MARRDVACVIGAVLVLWLTSAATRVDSRSGSDEQATALVGQLAPGYAPWAHAIFAPGAALEGWLFAAQTASGTALFFLILVRARRRAPATTDDAPPTDR